VYKIRLVHNLYSRIFIFVSLFVTCSLSAQVTISPPFATQNDNITITYDATQGNAALVGQSVVYAHTGVITNLSSNGNDWKHVQGNWGTDDSRLKMTSIGNNKFTLNINIASFYNVPSSEKVLKLAFVFRNLSGSIVGKSSDGGDIFVAISQGGLQILFTQPTEKTLVVSKNDSLHLFAYTSAKAPLSLYINDSLVKSISNDSVIEYHTVAAQTINYTAKLVAGTVSDSVMWVVRNPKVQFSPAGIVDGINYLNDTSVILQLFAPGKSFVYAIGDFSAWKPDSKFDMTRTPDGQRYWIQINGLIPGKEYRFQYRVDQTGLKIADPYSDKFLDPYNDQYINSSVYPGLISYPAALTTEFVSVFQTAQSRFNWKYSNSFNKPQSASLNIYELLIRDFTGKHDFATLMDTLDYLQKLGINAIELMPFNEFEGNESWGYNTLFYFAPDKYYGPKENIKKFVDECHRRGMAVIMDMVLNHSFGQSSMVRLYFDQAAGKPSAQNPWFNQDATHPYNVGYDFNHESVYTQQLVDTVLQYWVREYKIDGYRFDLSKGFTQKNTGSDVNAWSAYDPSRVVIWKRIADKFRTTCSDCYMILEHFADNNEQTILSNYGFMLWGNNNYQSAQATMGYSSDLNGFSIKTFGWNSPNLVSYMESHDEERLQFKNVNYGYTNANYNAKDTNIALRRNEAVAALYFLTPGPKMVWQFGEVGYDYTINYCPDGTVADACRTSNKPIRWDYMNSPARKHLHDVYAALMDLRNKYPVFNSMNYTATLTGNYKVVRGLDSLNSFLVIANTGVLANRQKPQFPYQGWWFDYFSGDSFYVNAVDTFINMDPGAYKVLTRFKTSKPQVTSIPESDNIISNGEFNFYPNPANGELFISTQNSIGGASIVSLYTIQGKLLNTYEMNGSLLKIDIENDGTYLISIKTEKGIITRKIINVKN